MAATKVTAADIARWKKTANDAKTKTSARLEAAKKLYDYYKGFVTAKDAQKEWQGVIDSLTETQAKETKLAQDVQKWRDVYKSSDSTDEQKLDAAKNLAEHFKNVKDSAGERTWSSNTKLVQDRINKSTKQNTSTTPPTGTSTPTGTTSPTDTKPNATGAATQAEANAWAKIANDKTKKLSERLQAAKNVLDWNNARGNASGIKTWTGTFEKLQKDNWIDIYNTSTELSVKQETAGKLSAYFTKLGKKADADLWQTRFLGGQPGTTTTGTDGSPVVNLPPDIEQKQDTNQQLAELISILRAQADQAAAGGTVTTKTPDYLDLPDSFSTLKAVFSQYGLTALADRIAEYQKGEVTDPTTGNKVTLLVNGKLDTDLMLKDLRMQPEYKERFAAKVARDEQIQKARASGQYTTLQPISEGDQLALEQQYTDLARQAGLPVGFYDNPQDFTTLIANDVSPSEYSTRINLAQQAALQSNAALRQQLEQQYGVTEGGLTAFFLDADRARAVTADLTNQYVRQFNQAALQVAGFSGAAAAQLAEQAPNAAVNASMLAQQGENLIGLTKETVGGEAAATTEQQLGNVLVGATQGNAGVTDYQALGDVEAALKRKSARYQGGGQIATTAQGVIGLTQANI